MLNDRFALVSAVLDDGRALDLFPLTLGRARVTISPTVESPIYDEAW